MKFSSMKRKLMVLCLVAFCLMAGSFLNGNLVKADVIWEPPTSDFIDTHRSECRYENREYVVMGKDGYLTAYVDPLSNIEVVRINNDKILRIMYCYTDKGQREWGMISNGLQYTPHNEVLWVQMSDLALIYDHIEFCKDHKSELQPMDDRFDGEQKEIYCNLWKYPNSGTITGRIFYPLGQGLKYLYVDEHGRTWSYLSYYCGQKGWICLDDPGNGKIETISPKPSVTASLLPTETPVMETPEPPILPTKTPEPVITTMPTDVPVLMYGLKCEFAPVNVWQGGFIGQFTVTNKGKMTIKNWQVSFKNDYEISSLWGAKLVSNKDGKCIVSNESWDAGIESGDTRCFSFVAQGDYKKTQWNARAVILD